MITLTDGAATLELDPEVGGRVSQLVVDGLDVLAHTGTKPTRWGSFVMAPWAGGFGVGGSSGQSSTRHRRSPCSSAR
jgi:hypothetical protein